MTLSLVIIEYKSINEIDFFIRNTKAVLGNADFEIIISSNSLYGLDKRDELQKKYSNARWAFNNFNGGFAYGMNEGLKIAKGDFLIVMNPDVRIMSSIMPMMEYLKENKNVGILAPKIVDKDGTIQDSLRHFITPWGFVMRHLDRIIHNSKLCVKELYIPFKCDWVIGAFMMCRRDFYEKVGGLSDDYFMYCEDMDWCKRAHLAGYDVVYYPGTTIEYKGTRSARKSWKYTKIFLQSLFTYWKKYGVK